MEAMGETTWTGRGFQLCHSLRISRVTGVGYRLESVADGIFIVSTTVVAAGDGQDAQYEQTGDEQQYKEAWRRDVAPFARTYCVEYTPPRLCAWSPLHLFEVRREVALSSSLLLSRV